MKKLTKALALVVAMVSLGTVATQAQQQQMEKLPLNPAARTGVLRNGFTYYIHKNNLPADQVDFYLAMKAGAILEKPEQRGLAHFLEHMSFNGTKHFPKSSLKEYLETIGVRFGYNLNAGTGIDMTVYNITNVPTTRPTVIDTCLLMLRDWAADLSLEHDEIDKERGVINEEWRTRMSAGQRLMEKALPQMYPGSKYADCLPIGSMDVVMKFDYQALKDYYHDWYRPELQAVVVVGNVDVDDVERKIRTLFGDIPVSPADAPAFQTYGVQPNEETIVVIETDKEQSNIQAMIFNKHDAIPLKYRNTVPALVHGYIRSMIGAMMGERLNEIRQQANPPFIAASAGDGYFYAARTAGAFNGFVNCKEDAIKEGFSTLYREMQRVRRFGFTASEYERARANYLRHLETSYNERDKRRNGQITNGYVQHYLFNEPCTGVEYTYGFFNQTAPMITIENVNETLQHLFSDNNKVVTLFAPEKEGLTLPTKAEMLSWMAAVEAEELTPYEDNVSNEPLISTLPKKGSIVKTTADSPEFFGATVMELSNGARVIIKTTDFKADEIRMKAVSKGGTSLLPIAEANDIRFINSVSGIGGYGKFSQTDLQKALAGKNVWMNTSVGMRTESMSAGGSPKDLETMMQLVYLGFTDVRKDDEAFASYKQRTLASLKNQELNPMIALVDTVNSAFYMNHPLVLRTSSDMVEKINYDRVLEMYKERFADASDFTFVFVGNVDVELITPLVEQYLAALPAKGKKETFGDPGVNMRKGMYKNEFVKEQETPKATVLAVYSAPCEYNLRNKLIMSLTDQVLDLIYTEKVREEKGGTYGVSAGGSLDKYPEEEMMLQIMFDTAPEKKDELVEIIFAELERLGKEGPSATDLAKAKEYTLKQHAEQLKENHYWLGSIDEKLFTGVDRTAGYADLVNSITANEVAALVTKLLAAGNRIEVIMKTAE